MDNNNFATGGNVARHEYTSPAARLRSVKLGLILILALVIANNVTRVLFELSINITTTTTKLTTTYSSLTPAYISIAVMFLLSYGVAISPYTAIKDYSLRTQLRAIIVAVLLGGVFLMSAYSGHNSIEPKAITAWGKSHSITALTRPAKTGTSSVKSSTGTTYNLTYTTTSNGYTLTLTKAAS